MLKHNLLEGDSLDAGCSLDYCGSSVKVAAATVASCITLAKKLHFKTEMLKQFVQDQNDCVRSPLFNSPGTDLSMTAWQMASQLVVRLEASTHRLPISQHIRLSCKASGKLINILRSMIGLTVIPIMSIPAAKPLCSCPEPQFHHDV